MQWEPYGHSTVRSKCGRYRINKRSIWGKTEYVLMRSEDNKTGPGCVWKFVAKGATAEEMKIAAQQIQQ